MNLPLTNTIFVSNYTNKIGLLCLISRYSFYIINSAAGNLVTTVANLVLLNFSSQLLTQFPVLWIISFTVMSQSHINWILLRTSWCRLTHHFSKRVINKDRPLVLIRTITNFPKRYRSEIKQLLEISVSIVHVEHK